MDAEKCKILVETLDAGSITKAAENLGYTTSGISKAITSLEEETGFSLIQRKHNGIIPTAECELLIPLLRELVSTMIKIDQTASGIKGMEIGTLNIGSSYDFYYKWITGLVAEFFSGKPGIKVKITSAVSSSLNERLNNHTMDVCIMSKRDGDYDWISLKTDKLVAIVPKNHPFVSRGIFPIRAFASEPYIQIYPGNETDNSRMFAKNNISPRVQFTCADGPAAVPLVEAGLGVFVVNELIASSLKGDIAILPLYPQQLVEIGIATYSIQTAPPLVKNFVEYIKTKSEEIM